MSNFAQDIEKEAGGEAIEAIVIGRYGWDEDGPDTGTPIIRGVPLAWTDARPMLDYSYSRGYGGAECHAIYAWTQSFVLLVREYDGSTDVEAVPRNPVACSPQTIGG